jgi:hypothetical protein
VSNSNPTRREVHSTSGRVERTCAFGNSEPEDPHQGSATETLSAPASPWKHSLGMMPRRGPLCGRGVLGIDRAAAHDGYGVGLSDVEVVLCEQEAVEVPATSRLSRSSCGMCPLQTRALTMDLAERSGQSRRSPTL